MTGGEVKVRRVDGDGGGWAILACRFLVWFVHGLELFQEGGGGEDVG